MAEAKKAKIVKLDVYLEQQSLSKAADLVAKIAAGARLVHADGRRYEPKNLSKSFGSIWLKSQWR